MRRRQGRPAGRLAPDGIGLAPVKGADAAGAHFCEPPGVKEGIINERIYDRTE